jgi:hypothetical protein
MHVLASLLVLTKARASRASPCVNCFNTQEYVLPLDYEVLLQLAGEDCDLEAAMAALPAEALACAGAAVHEVRAAAAAEVAGPTARRARTRCGCCAGGCGLLSLCWQRNGCAPSAPPAGPVCPPQGTELGAARRRAGPRPHRGAPAQLRALRDAHAAAQVQDNRCVRRAAEGRRTAGPHDACEGPVLVAGVLHA